MGTLIMGLILILADLVLSNPFFILFTCFSLFPLPSFPSSLAAISASELEEEEEEEEEEDGDKEEARCFFNLNSSFHKTVHFGGLGDGSSSTNQLTLLLSSLVPSFTPSVSFPLRLILLSFSDCCICQKGRSFPSKKSSSAVNIAWLLTLLDRNSNSAFLTLSISFSLAFSPWEFGLKVMKSCSSRNSAEKEIRGLECCSLAVEVVWTVSMETILVVCGSREKGNKVVVSCVGG